MTQGLVLNCLLAPQPLAYFEAWLAETALPDLLGVSAEQCNDDRFARALDALSPYLDALWQDLIVIVGASRAFDVDLARLDYGWATTSPRSPAAASTSGPSW